MDAVSFARGRVSFAVLVVYGSLCGLLTEGYPFTTVPMYADLGVDADRADAAVPVVYVDGARANLMDYERFTGPSTEDILPWDRCRANGVCGSFPSSDPRDSAFAEWIDEHPAEAGDLGPSRVEVTYVLLSPRGDGYFNEERVVVWEGSAWPRNP